MFTFIHSAVRHFRAANAARRGPDLSLLSQRERDTTQERLVRSIETRLFFDADLLASAQARQSFSTGLKKTILAGGAGLLLIVSPFSGQAEEKAVAQNAAAESSEPATASTPSNTLGGWLEELVGTLDDEGDDPKDGDHD